MRVLPRIHPASRERQYYTWINNRLAVEAVIAWPGPVVRVQEASFRHELTIPLADPPIYDCLRGIPDLCSDEWGTLRHDGSGEAARHGISEIDPGAHVPTGGPTGGPQTRSLNVAVVTRPLPVVRDHSHRPHQQPRQRVGLGSVPQRL